MNLMDKQKPFVKDNEEKIKAKYNDSRRKNLLKDLYNKYFETNGNYEIVSVNGNLEGSEFEKYVDYTILEELGYVYLVFRDKGNISKPTGNYTVSITTRGIIAYESW